MMKILSGRSVAVAALIAASLVPIVVDSSYHLQVLTQLLIYSILFVGLDVAVGQAGLVSMAHGALFGIGAYVTGVVTVKYAWSFWPSLPLAVLGAAVVGLVIGLITLRLGGHYFVVATLGLGGVVTIVTVNWDSVTNGSLGLSPVPVPWSPGGWFLELQGVYYLMLVVCVLVTLGVWLLMQTETGQRLRAIRDNQGLAGAVGVDVTRTRLVAFVVSAGIAGLAGSFQASYLSYISPDIGNLDMAFAALLAVIVGGRASVAGPFLGAAIFIMLPEVLRGADQYRHVVLGAALIVVVIFAPDGIAGRVKALWHAVVNRLTRLPDSVEIAGLQEERAV